MDKDPSQPTTVTKRKPRKRGRSKDAESDTPRKRGRPKKADTGDKDVIKYIPYPCTECGMAYDNKYRFQMHCHKVHGAEEPQREKLCTGCGKFFGTAGDLRRHRKTHHMDIPMMACTLCNKQIRVSNLTRHLKDVHNSEKYGGAGGTGQATVSINQHAPPVAVHELGHSLFGLADECVCF